MIVTDGTKSIPLSSLRPDAWTPADPLEGDATPQSATKLAGSVPVLYRCIDIRANAVAGVPYRLEKNGKAQDGPEIDKLRETLHNMLWMSEAGLCFKAAYWELGTNRVGKNLTAFWLSPWTITPNIDPRAGLVNFFRTGGAGAGEIPPDKMLYIWNPDPAVEIGPGRAPVEVVLNAAGLLWALDAYAKAYFARGGTKITLLSVPPTTPLEERKKIKSWWDMVTRGVKNMWGSMVLNSEIKATVIGSDPKETAAPELNSMSRENVMLGMGVPQSLVLSNPLAGGTVSAERLNFYDFTVLPRVKIIWPAINQKYLAPMGLRAIPEPEKLEAYVQSELSKAQSITGLVGEPILLVDEGRAMLDKEPRGIAQQKLDIQIKEQRAAEGLPEPPPEPTQPGMEEGVPADPSTMPPAELPLDEEESAVKSVIPLYILDLQRWEAKALKRPGKPFEFRPDALSLEDTAWIKAGLVDASADEIKTLFDSMKKAPGDDLTERERVLFEKLKKTLARYGDEVTAQIVKGDTVDLSTLEPPLRAALLADLTAVALEVMGGLADSIGPDFDIATMGGKAMEWAQSYTYDRVKGITETTRKVVQQATAAFFRDGLSSKEVSALLSPTFGERKADAISSTEITRAASQATVMYQKYLEEAGLFYDLVWLTSNDERTCAICTPRNGKVQGDGWDEPAPGHTRCRCRMGLVKRGKK